MCHHKLTDTQWARIKMCFPLATQQAVDLLVAAWHSTPLFGSFALVLVRWETEIGLR